VQLPPDNRLALLWFLCNIIHSVTNDNFCIKNKGKLL